MQLSSLNLALTRPRSGASAAAAASTIDTALVTQTLKYAYGAGRVIKGYNSSIAQVQPAAGGSIVAASCAASSDNLDWAALDSTHGANFKVLFPYDQSGNARHCTAHTAPPASNPNAPKWNGARPFAFASFSAPSGSPSASGQFVLPAAVSIDPASHWTVIVAGVANDGATSGTASYMATWGTGVTMQQLRSGTGSQSAGGALALVDTRGGVTTAQCTNQNAVTPQIIHIITRGAGQPVEFYIDGVLQSVGTAGTSVTATGGYIGGDGTSAAANMNVLAWLEFAGPPTAGDLTYVDSILRTRFGLSATAPSVAVTWFGSSTMAEYRSLANGLVRRTAAAMSTANLAVAAGIAGTTMAQMVTGKAYLSGMRQSGKYNIAVCSQARNDANALLSGAIVGGETGIFANQMSFTTQLIADGWDKVVWLPSFDTDPVKFSGSGTDQTQKATVITNGAALLAAGQNGASGNPQYTCWNMHDHTAVIGPAYGTAAFDSDNIHTLETTQALLATTAGGLAVGMGLAAYLDSQCVFTVKGTISATGTSGLAFSDTTLTVFNAKGAVTGTVLTGSLPSGVTIGAGTLGGTIAPASSGPYSGTIRFTDGLTNSDVAFSIDVDAQKVLWTVARPNNFTTANTYYGAFNSQMPSVGTTAGWANTTHRGSTVYLKGAIAWSGANTATADSTFTLVKNGSDTGITLTLTAGVSSSFSVTSSVTLADGDTYRWKLVKGGTGNLPITVALYGVVYAQTFVQFGQVSTDSVTAGTKRYFSLSGNNGSPTAGERWSPILEACTLSALQVISGTAAPGPTPCPVRFYKRDVSGVVSVLTGTGTVAISAGSLTPVEDTTNSFSFVVGEAVCIEVDNSAGTGAVSINGLSCKYQGAVANQRAMYSGAGTTAGSGFAQTALSYATVTASLAAQTNELVTQVIMPWAASWSRLTEMTAAISTNGSSRAAHFRVGAVTKTLATSVPTTAAVDIYPDTTHTDTTVANDKVSILQDLPSSGQVNMAAIGVLMKAT